MDHVVIVALDEVVDDQLLPVDDRRCLLRSSGEFNFFFFSARRSILLQRQGENFFMTEDYLRMMWTRIYIYIYTFSRWGIPLSFR